MGKGEGEGRGSGEMRSEKYMIQTYCFHEPVSASTEKKRV